MSRIDELLQGYIREHREGGAADPRAFLREVTGTERDELAALIDHYLSRAPGRPFDREAFERFRADPRWQAAVERILAPTLSQLRQEAKLSKREITDALAKELDVLGHEPAVKARYHELETGQLDPQRIAARVWTTLATMFRESTEALQAAAESSREGARSIDSAGVFARRDLEGAANSPDRSAQAGQASPPENPVDAAFFSE